MTSAQAYWAGFFAKVAERGLPYGSSERGNTTDQTTTPIKAPAYKPPKVIRSPKPAAGPPTTPKTPVQAVPPQAEAATASRPSQFTSLSKTNDALSRLSDLVRERQFMSNAETQAISDQANSPAAMTQAATQQRQTDQVQASLEA